MKRKRLNLNTLTDRHVRELHNGFLDGTATDAIGRHLCHVALGECCIGTDSPVMPLRYPTPEEIEDARSRLCHHWNRGIE